MTVQIAAVSWLGWILVQLQSIIISGIKAAVKRNQELVAFAAGGKPQAERAPSGTAALLGWERWGVRWEPRGGSTCQEPSWHLPCQKGLRQREAMSHRVKSHNQHPPGCGEPRRQCR